MYVVLGILLGIWLVPAALLFIASLTEDVYSPAPWWLRASKALRWPLLVLDVWRASRDE